MDFVSSEAVVVGVMEVEVTIFFVVFPFLLAGLCFLEGFFVTFTEDNVTGGSRVLLSLSSAKMGVVDVSQLSCVDEKVDVDSVSELGEAFTSSIEFVPAVTNNTGLLVTFLVIIPNFLKRSATVR